MDTLYRQALLQGVFGLVFFVALIFGTAGTWDYWQGWVFLAVFAISTTAFTFYLAIYDKPLLERRLKAGLHRSSRTRLPVSPLTGAGLGLHRRRRDHRVLVPRHLLGHQDQQLGRIEHPRGDRSESHRHRPLCVRTASHVRGS